MDAAQVFNREPLLSQVGRGVWGRVQSRTKRPSRPGCLRRGKKNACKPLRRGEHNSKLHGAAGFGGGAEGRPSHHCIRHHAGQGAARGLGAPFLLVLPRALLAVPLSRLERPRHTCSARNHGSSSPPFNSAPARAPPRRQYGAVGKPRPHASTGVRARVRSYGRGRPRIPDNGGRAAPKGRRHDAQMQSHLLLCVETAVFVRLRFRFLLVATSTSFLLDAMFSMVCLLLEQKRGAVGIEN